MRMGFWGVRNWKRSILNTFLYGWKEEDRMWKGIQKEGFCR